MDNRQGGMILIEALIGILIFSMGILALVAMQGAAVSAQSDAQYRIEASNLVNRLLSDMWLNINRTSAATMQTSLNAFAHQASGSNCSFSGTASSDAVVTGWVTELTSGSTRLPGATSAMQQVIVDTGTFNRVTITVCWKAPNETVTRRHTVISHVN